MKKYSVLFLVLLISGGLVVSLISSCTLSESGMKRSIGATNELLVVTNDKEQWNGPLGDTIRAFFAANQIGLPQPEPIFDLLNVADENFNSLFQKYHNIFIVDINPNEKDTLSETKQDIWAAPQRVIKLTAPNLQAFYTEFHRTKESYLKFFVELERDRILAINRMAVDMSLSSEVEKKFGINLPLPGGFYKAEETGDFMWLRHVITNARKDVELGILIYSMNYEDTIVFKPAHIIQWRNAITMEHVPGPAPDSYMKVAPEYIPPVFKTVTDFPGGYAVETRGLWDVKNDFMGGPFLSYTFVDKYTNRVITLDGYVYNPNDIKKDYLRQLEAIFYATGFVKPNK